MYICDISIINRYGKSLLDSMLDSRQMNWRDLVSLLVIHEQPDILQADLTPYLQTDKANISKLLGELEKQKLIQRSKDPNNYRQNRCRLTETGETLLPELEKIMRTWENTCFAGFSEEELLAFKELNHKVVTNFLDIE